MISFSYDCPHPECLTKNTGFQGVQPVATQQRKAEVSLFAQCNTCGRGIVLHLKYKPSVGGHLDFNYIGQSQMWAAYDVITISPKPLEPDLPDHLPATVATRMFEVENAFASHKSPLLIGMGLRAVIEAAVKNLDREAKGNLFQRIDALSALLPPSLIALLHTVRIFGNDSAHDTDADALSPEQLQDEIIEARELVRLFLIYTFELPARVAAAQAKRAKA